MDDPYKLAKNILLSGEDGPIAAPGGGFTSIELYGAAACENAAADGGVRFHLENESGTGDITLYRVFPGIELVYNDMYMAYCNKHQQPAANVMEINYCKEGRSECLFGECRYCYMSAGIFPSAPCMTARTSPNSRRPIITALPSPWIFPR